VNKHPERRAGIIISISLGILAGACGLGSADATPTMSAEMIETQAVAAFAAGLTETALAMPTETSTPTPSPSPTMTTTPEQTSTAAATTAVSLPTSSCFSMAYEADVTVPDNTSMTPGQTFTKTWRVRNNGSCAWETGFNLTFTGGEAMGGTAVALTQAVAIGDSVELSVPLTAPSTNGTYRGNWRMTRTNGTFFGDEVYVLIIVGGSTPTSTAAAATATPSQTQTSTTETPST
jgi:hypothetical protein